MKKRYLYMIWAVLYCACVGFSFVGEATGGEKAFLLALSVGFFVPPYWLYFLARKENSRKTVLALRLISIIVLALVPVLFFLNVLSVNYTTTFGLVVFVLFVMFSPPLLTSQTWVIPLFLWAVLMMLTLPKKCPCQK